MKKICLIDRKVVTFIPKGTTKMREVGKNKSKGDANHKIIGRKGYEMEEYSINLLTKTVNNLQGLFV